MFHFWGRENLALTVMVPYDCKNSCPFCTSKKDYQEHPGCGQAVEDTMKHVFKKCNFPIRDVVFTGGEPAASVETLKKLVALVPDDKNVFVNTTLPNDTAVEFAAYVNAEHKIKCVNISRHEAIYGVETLEDVVPDGGIKLLIHKPVRINVVLQEQPLMGVLERWRPYDVEVSLRADYTKVTTRQQLKNPYDQVVQDLIWHGYKVTGHGSCDVCETVRFEKNGQKVQYHRGMYHSSINNGTVLEINDLIVRQDGKLMYDWEGTDDKIMQQVRMRHTPGLWEKRVLNKWEPVEGPIVEKTEVYTCGGAGC